MDRRVYKQLREIEETHWWFRGRRKILRAAIDQAGIRAKSILEVGCGAGTNLDLLNELQSDSFISGIDIELEPLRFCVEDRSVPVCQADFNHLPFAASTFDMVTALDALEHVKDDQAALAEMHRVCRPKGAILITVPAFPFLWGNVDVIGHHYRRYGKRELTEKVTHAGFSIHFVRFFNYLLFPPIAAVRLLARLVHHHASPSENTVRSDFDLVKSGPLNALLAAIFSMEASMLRVVPPFGVSLLCVAVRRPH
ncbi:MAG: hypothetical protein A2Y74_00525 [Actinobacteria bacterium RBG_13_63_9]|nr:MAG: hypothetical protein A2Y74_00525 [Actinobacteria bacterium RBG_13_63_9]